MNEVLAAIVGAIVGALAVYVVDIRKTGAERREREREIERERRHLRSTVATALMLDLRGLETVLRQFVFEDNPAHWLGQKPSLYFDSLRGDVRLFSSHSVPKVDEFYRRVDNLFTTLEKAASTQKNNPHFDHYIKTTAGFALQSLADAKNALVEEGGQVPPPRVLEVMYYPDLPTIPPLSFPDVAPPGRELPEELR
jgi:hypothetical protein